MKRLVALLVIIACSEASFEGPERIEEEGYYKREHSLVQPYHGERGSEVWGVIDGRVCVPPIQVREWTYHSGGLVGAQ